MCLFSTTLHKIRNIFGWKVVEWDGQKEFRLVVTSGTLSTNYNGGMLNVAGVSVGIATVVSGSNIVRVMSVPSIPFILHDDDEATHPFQVDISLMQTSDQTNDNLFAAGYVIPVYIQYGTNIAAFVRNINSAQIFASQIDAGRDLVSLPRFWTAYIQGMFQGLVLQDHDPNIEATGLGLSFLSSRGGGVFVESVRDYEVSKGLQPGTVLRKTTIHEVGHQFGLLDNTGEVMNQGWPIPLYFTEEHLHTMRNIPNP